VIEPASEAGRILSGPRYLAENDVPSLAANRSGPVLAVVLVGLPVNDPAPWLTAHVPCPPLRSGLAEVWPASGPVARFDFDGARAAGDGTSLFVALEAPGTGAGIDRLAFDAYRRLLHDLERSGYPHLLRAWNFVPAIHDRHEGLDRYKLFCKGRSEAFAARHGDLLPSRLPAASAVGYPGNALVVHALASREPGRHVENPRQVSAYRYPERYGPRSPTFARATVAPRSAGGALFVSGTASIVGHESVHPGDPARQTEETLTNIASVLDSAGIPGMGGPLGPRLDSLRVYARHPGDLDTIRSVVSSATGGDVPSAWLRADICRDDLLVEIEAIAQPEESAYGV
jgi:chorismate lyase/3-hydroxybenzoate synthase